MKFSDFICNEAIRPELKAQTKDEVIREIAGALGI